MHAILQLLIGTVWAVAPTATLTPIYTTMSVGLESAVVAENNQRARGQLNAAGTPGVVKGEDVTPTAYPFQATISLTPALFGTTSPNTVLLVRGIWDSSAGQRIQECNALGTPGPEISNAEVHLTTKADITRAIYLKLVAANTPVTLGGLQRQSQ